MTLQLDRLNLARLKTSQLLLLVHLDEKRSLLHAASALHMTQPAATRLLKSLEDTLGAQLFERHARGVIPTEFGEIAIRHARVSITELQQTRNEILSLQAGMSGQVVIGTEWSAATTYVPRAVALLKQRFPQILVNIEMEFSEVCIKRLQESILDIAIARVHRLPDASELRYEPLSEVRHNIVGRVGHPLSRKRHLTLGDLTSQTWVLPPQGNVMRERLTLCFLEQGLPPPKQVVETSALSITTRLLHMSDMIAALATDDLQPYSTEGTLKALAVKVDLRISPAGIVTQRDRKLSPGAEAMLRVLREVAGISPDGSGKLVVKPLNQ
jgi:DNA-binding transcriptional LysR family regulator